MAAIKRAGLLLLSLAFLILTMILPPAGAAGQPQTVVRVGWFESPFYTKDRFGRSSGYAYEYQQKIAAHTGWKYEYVQASWPQLLQMLIEGKIDLMADVSYTPARAEQMLFPDLPMGSEDYYLFIKPDSTKIRLDDLQTLSGKRVGVNKGSLQAGLFRDWARRKGIEVDLIELTSSEADSMRMLHDGRLDAFITLDAYGGLDTAVPVSKIGSSEFFFSVSKKRPDLLAALNAAMNKIHDQNRFYNQQLARKYVSSAGANLFLDFHEKVWLTGHGTIRLGYQDNYLAFCAADKSGELTGALREYLEQASSVFKNARLQFKAIAYPTAGDAIRALQKGEVDCMFPSSLSTADGEQADLIMPPPMMTSDIYAVVRKQARDSFFKRERIVAAAEEHDPNSAAILKEHFPDWQVRPCADLHSCLKAVSDGSADCYLVNNYQLNSLSGLERLGLTALATARSAEHAFALNRGSTELYSILTRTTSLVRISAINAALNYYSSKHEPITLIEIVRSNPVSSSAVLLALLAMASVIVIQRRLIITRKNVEASRHEVDRLSKEVFVDALTKVRNRAGFNQYMRTLQDEIDRGAVGQAAVIVFDCDNLKVVNDRFGHNKGDACLLYACSLICRVFKHSPVFRLGGDEFAAVLLRDDYARRDKLVSEFNRRQKETVDLVKNPWEQVNVSLGMAVLDPKTDCSLSDLLRRADKLMYENKSERKKARQAASD